MTWHMIVQVKNLRKNGSEKWNFFPCIVYYVAVLTTYTAGIDMICHRHASDYWRKYATTNTNGRNWLEILCWFAFSVLPPQDKYCHFEKKCNGIWTQYNNNTTDDSSPENYVHGAVYGLLVLSIALSHCEYQAKNQRGFFYPRYHVCDKYRMLFCKK